MPTSDELRKIARAPRKGESTSPFGLNVAGTPVGGDYADPAKYEELVVRERAAGMPGLDPQALERIVKGNPGIGPDAALTALVSGLAGDSAFVRGLQQAEATQRSEAEKARLAKQAENAKSKRSNEEFSDGWFKDDLKSISRVTTGVLQFPGELINNTFARALPAQLEEWRGENAMVQGNDPDWGGVLDGTTLGRMGDGLDTGNGWFIGEDTQVGQARQAIEADLFDNGTGQIATFGRTVVGDTSGYTGWVPGSTAFDLVSGLIDFPTAIMSDPTMFAQPIKAVKVIRGIDDASLIAKGLKPAANSALVSDLAGKAAKAAKATDEVEKVTALKGGLTPETIDRVISEWTMDAGSRVGAAAGDVKKAAAESAASKPLGDAEEALSLVGRLQHDKVRIMANLSKKVNEETAGALSSARKSVKAARAAADKALPAPAEGVRVVERTSREAADVTLAKTTLTGLVARVAEATGQDADKVTKALLARPVRTVGGYFDRLEDVVAKGGSHSGEAYQKALALRDEFAAAMEGAGARVQGVRGHADNTDVQALLGGFDAVAPNAQTLARQKTVIEALDNQIDSLVREAEEANTLAYSLAESSLKDRGIAVPDIKTAEGLAEHFRAEFGLLDAAGGPMVAMNRMLDTLMGGKGDAVAKALSEVDDADILHRATRGKLRDHQLRELTKMKDPEEIKRYLAEEFSRGSLSREIGSLRALRATTRMINNVPVGEVSKVYQKSFGLAAAATKWSVDAGSRRAASSYRDVHLEDGTEVLNYTSDYFTQVTRELNFTRGGATREAVETLRADMVRALVNAESGPERYSIVTNAVQGVQDLALASLHESSNHLSTRQMNELVEAIRESSALSVGRMRGQAHFSVAVRDLSGPDGFRFAGVDVPGDGNLALYEADLTDHLRLPDVGDLRRAVDGTRSLIAAGKAPTVVREFATEAFGRHWKTLMLVGRPTYIIRNTLETQIRMALSGHPSAFTNSVGTLALLMDGRLAEPVQRMLNKAVAANQVDALGNTFTKVDGEDMDLTEARDLTSRLLLDNGSRIEFRGGERVMERVVEAIDTTDPRFYKGLSQEIIHAFSDRMGRQVFKVAFGNGSGDVQAILARNPGMTKEDALVEFYLNGAGREVLDKVRLSKVGHIGGNDKTRAEFAESIRDALDTPEGVRNLLFGDDPGSYGSRWKAYLNNNTQVMDMLASKRFSEYALGRKRQAPGELAALESELAGVLAKEFGDAVADGSYAYNKVGIISPVGRTRGRTVADLGNDFVEIFFNWAGRIERDVAIAPEYTYTYWERVADMASALTPQDAAKLVESARKELGGHLPGSWASRTLKRVERETGKAAGDGGLTLTHVSDAAKNQAAIKTRELFYDARKTNALAQSMRLASPFAQAWGNSIRTYAKLMNDRPQTAYAAEMFYQDASGASSNAIYDALGYDHDEEQGFFFTNPTTRQVEFMIPLLSEGLSALHALATGGDATSGGQASIPLNSLNLATQNSWTPTAGPVVQIGMGQIDQSKAYRHAAAFLDDIGFGAVNDWAKPAWKDPDAPAEGFLAVFTPSFIKPYMAMFARDQYRATFSKYVPGQMAAMLSEHPGRYMSTDSNGVQVINEDLLVKDSERRAVQFAIARQTVALTQAGSVSADVKIKGKDGRAVALSVIDREASDLRDQGVPTEQVTRKVMAKYGVAATLALTYGKEFQGDSRMSGYQWMQKNMDAADEHADVIGFFFPDGEFSREMYQWQRDAGQGRKYTDMEIVKQANSMLMNAQIMQIEEQALDGTVSEAQATRLKTQVRNGFKVKDADKSYNSNRGEQIANVQKALDNDAVLATEAGQAAFQYEALRQQALTQVRTVRDEPDVDKPFSGKAAAPMREWLRINGEALKEDYPQFRSLWDKVYASEVAEK